MSLYFIPISPLISIYTHDLCGQKYKHPSLKLLNSKCTSDRRQVERWLNSIIFPALYRLGVLSEDCSIAYEQEG